MGKIHSSRVLWISPTRPVWGRRPDTGHVDLVIAPCRQLCDWQPSPAAADDQRLLACTGCGSQWTAAERWTPRQADGSEPPAVRAELSRVEVSRAELSRTELSRTELDRRG